MIKFLRRQMLGRTSVRGMINAMQTEGAECRRWRDIEINAIMNDDLVIRWGCTANINNNSVLNTARAIHQVNDKAGFRMHLMEHAPELIPETWFPENIPQFSSGNCLMRPATHSQGRNMIICTNRNDVLVQSQMAVFSDGYYLSEIIEKVAEYRVFVVQGRAVAVAEKTPGNPDDIAWNVARGGRFDNVSWDNWPLQAVRKSIEAFNLSELDFGGVDVMVDADGRAYVIEINSAPSLTSEYRQECMAKAFDWIVEYGKSRIPLISERGGYKKFIHPAVCGNARLVEPSDEMMNQINSSEILGDNAHQTASVDTGEDFDGIEGHSQPEWISGLEVYTNLELINELDRRSLI